MREFHTAAAYQPIQIFTRLLNDRNASEECRRHLDEEECKLTWQWLLRRYPILPIVMEFETDAAFKPIVIFTLGALFDSRSLRHYRGRENRASCSGGGFMPRYKLKFFIQTAYILPLLPTVSTVSIITNLGMFCFIAEKSRKPLTPSCRSVSLRLFRFTRG